MRDDFNNRENTVMTSFLLGGAIAYILTRVGCIGKIIILSLLFSGVVYFSYEAYKSRIETTTQQEQHERQLKEKMNELEQEYGKPNFEPNYQEGQYKEGIEAN